MSNMPHDINDDEIRIISSNKETRPPEPEPGYRSKLLIPILLIALGVAILLFFIFSGSSGDESETLGLAEHRDTAVAIDSPATDSIVPAKGFVEISDTVVNAIPLSIFTPFASTPRLQIGAEALRDSDAVLVVQAADIRGDNGMIVGSFVVDGKLLSTGQSKTGFCAIIGGTPIIGVADSTPYLEQALESGGYFFRQYPLVVGNQVVENKPKGKALRKALAEWNGRMVVVMSRGRVTFHDFAQALVDMGVSNAIYLVGSAAYGVATDASGNRIEFGIEQPEPAEFINYMVWK